MAINFQYQNPGISSRFVARPLDFSPLTDVVDQFVQKGEIAKENVNKVRDFANTYDAYDPKAAAQMKQTLDNVFVKNGIAEKDKDGNITKFKNPSWNYDKFQNAIREGQAKVAVIANTDKRYQEATKQEQADQERLGNNYGQIGSSIKGLGVYNDKGELRNPGEFQNQYVDLSKLDDKAKEFSQAINFSSQEGNWETGKTEFPWLITQATKAGMSEQDLQKLIKSDEGKGKVFNMLVQNQYLDDPKMKQYFEQKVQLDPNRDYAGEVHQREMSKYQQTIPDSEYYRRASEMTQNNPENTSIVMNQLKQKDIDEYENSVNQNLEPLVKQLQNSDREKQLQQIATKDFNDRVTPHLMLKSGLNQQQNSGYWDNLSQSRKQKDVPTYDVPVQGRYSVNPEQSVEQINKDFEDASNLGKNNPVQSTVSATTLSNPFDITSAQKVTNIGVKANNAVSQKVETWKKDFKKLYDENNARGGNDQTFMKVLRPALIEQAKNKTLITSLPDTKMQTKFDGNMKYHLMRNANSEVEVDGKKTPVKDLLGLSKAAADRDDIATTEFDLYEGNIIVHTNKGKEFKMNKDMLDEKSAHILNITSKVLQNNTNFNDDAFKPIVDNKETAVLNGNTVYVAYVKDDTEPDKILRVFSQSPGDDKGNVNKKDIYQHVNPSTGKAEYVTSPQYPPLNGAKLRHNAQVDLFMVVDPQATTVGDQNTLIRKY